MKNYYWFLFFTCSFLYGNSNGQSSKSIRIKLDKRIYKRYQSAELEFPKLLSIPGPVIWGGDYKSDKVSFRIALQDGNGDGVFNSIGKDFLSINLLSADSIYIVESSSNSKIAASNIIQVRDFIFIVNGIDSGGKFVDIVRGKKEMKPTVRLFDTIPSAFFSLLDGSSVNLCSYVGKGKLIYVDIWGTWCGPCITEIPKLKEIQQKFADEITLISLDFKDDDRGKVDSFIKKHEMTWVNGFSTDEINLAIEQNGYPYGVLFDENGHVLLQNITAIELKAFLNKSKAR